MVEKEDEGAPSGEGRATAAEPVVSALRDGIPSAYAAIAESLPDGLTWSYKASVRAGHLYHQWELKGPRGGIHVSATWHDFGWRDDYWTGGIEGHSPIAPEYREDTRPDNDLCWLLEGPCWHDGSSLQFSEQIAPWLPREDGAMGAGEHLAILPTMLHRYDSWLPSAQAIETQRAKTEGLGPKDESVVGIADAPDPHAERERKISREGAEDEGCGAGEVR